MDRLLIARKSSATKIMTTITATPQIGSIPVTASEVVVWVVVGVVGVVYVEVPVVVGVTVVVETGDVA